MVCDIYSVATVLVIVVTDVVVAELVVVVVVVVGQRNADVITVNVTQYCVDCMCPLCYQKNNVNVSY